MWRIALCAALASCGPPEPPTARASAVAAAPVPDATAAAPVVDAALAAPGELAPRLQLPAGVAPVRYELSLELDPDRDAFAGHVVITIAIAAPGTSQLWLNAADLEITTARLTADGRDDVIALVPGPPGSQLRGTTLARALGPGTATLAIDYTGRITELAGRSGKDEEGLFRERAGGRWYLYSQAESTFARRIVPCFDEPRWKPAWQVTVVVPRGQVALGNAPVAAERARADGRREVRFAEIERLPSYLLAVAVGPFDLVNVGKLGRGHVPVRLAVARGDTGRVAHAVRALPRIVDELERYVDAPLPLAKLDLVAVPEFFGAMENPGLITFEAATLVGGRDFVAVAAHELAHQWFGDSVTPAWWDELWLSEAFASWLDHRVTAGWKTAKSPEVAHRVRGEALAADDDVDARALVQPIASPDAPDAIEATFDAIAYEKGAAVLAAFEGFVGPGAFRAAVRSYLAGHRGTSVTSRAFLDALGAATRPEVAAALASNLGHAGTPVVGLAVSCTPTPVVVASARDGVIVPVCVRAPTTTPEAAHGHTSVRQCFLAGSHTVEPLAATVGCPAWLIGNAGGTGYYRVVPRGAALAAPVEAMSPSERLARGDDVAIAVRRGELPIRDALASLTVLAHSHDRYGELAALDIADALDPLVGDQARPAWAGWLAGWFAGRLTPAALVAPRSQLDAMVRDRLVELAVTALPMATLIAVRTALDRRPARDGAAVLVVAATASRDALFERAVAATTVGSTGAEREAGLEVLGAFGASYASRIGERVRDHRLSAAHAWTALEAMLARGETRTAAWRAVHAAIEALLAPRGGVPVRDVLAAATALCEPVARAELAADLAPRVAADAAPGVRRALEHTLATIDRCIARRAAAGDLVGALAASPPPGAALTPPR